MIESAKPISAFGQIPADGENLLLIICVEKSQISVYYIIDKQSFAVEIFKYSVNALETIIGNVSRFTKAKTDFIIDSRRFSLLPADLNLDADNDIIANTLFGNDNHFTIVNIVTNGYKLVFQIDSLIYNLLKTKLPKATVLHFSQLFICNVLAKSNAGKNVHFDVRDGYFYAALFDGSQLIMTNSFEYSDKNEFGFYALGSIHNSGFDPITVNLNVSGAVAEDSPLLELLKKYIPTVNKLNTENINPIYNSGYQIVNYYK